MPSLEQTQFLQGSKVLLIGQGPSSRVMEVDTLPSLTVLRSSGLWIGTCNTRALRADLIFSIEPHITEALLDARVFDRSILVTPADCLSRYCASKKKLFPIGLIDGVNYFELHRQPYLPTGCTAALACLQSGAEHLYLLGFDGPCNTGNVLEGSRFYRTVTQKATHRSWAERLGRKIQGLGLSKRVTLLLDNADGHPLQSIVEVKPTSHLKELGCHPSKPYKKSGGMTLPSS